MVYVTNRQGKALMPTDRHGKVRRLLKSGLAHVVRRIPFTIQLDYDTTEITQPITLGIDAGSKFIGVCATTDKKSCMPQTLSSGTTSLTSSLHVEKREEPVEAGFAIVRRDLIIGYRQNIRVGWLRL